MAQDWEPVDPSVLREGLNYHAPEAVSAIATRSVLPLCVLPYYFGVGSRYIHAPE